MTTAPHAPARRPRARLRAVAALVPALLLAACSTAAAPAVGPSDAAAASAGPVPGGTLRFALGASPSGVDPQQVGSNVSIYVARQLADSLTDQDPETGEIVPWLATSWDVSDDLTQFTFHLRDGVTFSDGTPLTAETVKANLDVLARGLGAGSALATSYLTGYVETRVDDESTATVVFEAPNAQFLQATSTVSLAILSDATTRVAPEARLQGDVVGSGPFVLESYTQDQGAVLTRRDGYAWASGVSDHDGEAYLDRIEFTVVPESGVRAGGLASDQFDAIGDVLPQDVAQVEAADGAVLTRTNPGVVFVLQPNVTAAPLDDPDVRRAVNLAIDRQQIVDTVLSDAFRPATSVLASTTPGYVELSDELAPDAAAASDLLDDAGWEPGDDGIRQKDGQRLTFDVVYAPLFTGSQAVLELVQQQLRAAGVDLQIRQQTPAEQQQSLTAGAFGTYYYNVTRADGDILRTQFSSTLRNINQRPADDVLDPLLDAQLAAADPAARADLVAQAQREVLDQGLAIPLFELAQSIGVAGGVHGVAFDASSRLLFHDAWIEAAS
ncbi:ABC transporter substrate-binding protein [Cellulomonas iranensis]|uniref:Peptide/nickel transport system substrate-binding protein n=1 Tax=Cellulomonas iranensis TaxID=76862 RepID=A0ABU0GN07_9CELL|nr:ABC transporter substrate-binding protein [Cellulomonas iranensis]MDQ0425965.1 peptide/nickel transport system substrate-binding protein [Cellulomonas iranensis]